MNFDHIHSSPVCPRSIPQLPAHQIYCPLFLKKKCFRHFHSNFCCSYILGCMVFHWTSQQLHSEPILSLPESINNSWAKSGTSCPLSSLQAGVWSEWVYTVPMHAITTAVNSCEQLCCCVWKTLFSTPTFTVLCFNGAPQILPCSIHIFLNFSMSFEWSKSFHSWLCFWLSLFGEAFHLGFLTGLWTFHF